MTKSTRRKLIAFAILAAVGVTYVAVNYLGFANSLLGKQVSMYVSLPRSGGLFVGSEVDVRGVKVGKVTDMQLTHQGVTITMQIDKGTKIPVASPLKVANLTAVGEQYLDFQPADKSGPFAAAGHTFAGNDASLPEPTDRLLGDINSFVNSVDVPSLQTAVGELGTMFRGNGTSVAKTIDAGQKFVAEAVAHQQAAIDLIESSKTVLGTQVAHANDILAFSKGLAQLTDTLRTSDPNLRAILNQGDPALNEADSLVKMLAPVLPPFLDNLIAVNQVVDQHLAALEETLVVFPPVVATGFTGTPGDGYGHLNMQFDNNVPVCQGAGYLPKPWPSPLDTSDLPLYPARCNDPKGQKSYTGSGALLQRGVNMAPNLLGRQ